MSKIIEEMAKCMANCENTCDECFEQLERVMAKKIKNREQHCLAYMYAKRAVEQGYRKVPEDSIVLTREELSKRDYEFRQIGYDDCVRDNPKKDKYIETLERKIDQLNAKFDQARKETAEKIIKDLWDNQFETTITIQHNSSKEDIENVGKAIITLIRNKLVELAKQFGVEIKE